MHRQLEKEMADRAVGIGNAGDGAALPELAGMLTQPSVQVRRLAASAIGKLAGFADAGAAVAALVPLLSDGHPQVRQYAVKALKAYGADASDAIADLRDLAANESEKEYNRRDAVVAIEVIAEALRIREKQAVHCCQRCGQQVGSDEYARSHRAFQRCFCDRCFDEVYLERRNFDTRVELNKTIRATDGTLVQSRGERRVADWLTQHGFAFRYDERVRIIEGYAVRPDFYLPELDIYVEYWGMDTTDYKIGMLKKKKLYQQEGKKLISIEREETDRIEAVLEEKLSRRIPLLSAGGAVRCHDGGGGVVDTVVEQRVVAADLEVGEEAETACLFEVLGRYRDSLHLLLFRDNGKCPPVRALSDTERLERTRAYGIHLRTKLAAALGTKEHASHRPALSQLLRSVVGEQRTVPGATPAPFVLLWELTHAAPFRDLRLSEASACMLWDMRVRGMLDPDDPGVPVPDVISAVVLFVSSARDDVFGQTMETVRRLFTPPGAS